VVDKLVIISTIPRIQLIDAHIYFFNKLVD